MDDKPINVYIFGDRGVGKSSLTALLQPPSAYCTDSTTERLSGNSYATFSTYKVLFCETLNRPVKIGVIQGWTEGLPQPDVAAIFYSTNERRTYSSVINKWLPGVLHLYPLVPILAVAITSPSQLTQDELELIVRLDLASLSERGVAHYSSSDLETSTEAQVVVKHCVEFAFSGDSQDFLQRFI